MSRRHDTIAHSPLPVTVLRPIKGWVPLRLDELWEYRELLYFLAWRDLKVRYKQTILGGTWALLQPIFTMVVFSVFFGKLAQVPSDGLPYPVFAFAALVPWNFFSNALTQASNSLVLDTSMITKVYFPRLIMPTATVVAGLVDFALSFLVLMAMMLFYGIIPGVEVLWLPFFVLLTMITSLGVAYWFAAMNVQFRDVRYVVPFVVQAWLFISPIAYPSSLLSEPWRSIYGINPMAGVVEGFRWALLDTNAAPGPIVAVSAAAALLVLFSGAYYFRRLERTFADLA